MAQVIRDARANTQQVTKQSFVSLRRIIQRLNMFAGNHQHVCRRLRIDIANHEATIVLMDKLGRNLSVNDLAKQTNLI
jgi:hypothetical protein